EDMIRHQQEEVIVKCSSGFQGGDPVAFVIVRVFHPGEARPASPAVLEPVADHVTVIPQHDYELLNPRFLSAADHMFEDRPALKLHERFGEVGGNCPQTS